MTDRSNVPRVTSTIDLEEQPHERLRRMLDRAGLKNRAVAKAVGVAHETVSRWKGGQTPDDDTLRRVLELIARKGIVVTIGWIRYGEQEGAAKPHLLKPVERGAKTIDPSLVKPVARSLKRATKRAAG